MPAGYSFRPRGWALALSAAACAAGIALGNWQLERAAQKRSAAASIEQLALRGELDAKYTVFLDNKVHRGAPGYHVVQPLRLAGGKHVLVNRGWVPALATRDRLPEIRTPAGEIALRGVRLRHFARAYAPDASKPQGKVWQNVTQEAFSAWSGLVLEPYVIEQHSALDDALIRDWPQAESGAAKNESYALQWFALAALAVVLFFVLSIKREKQQT